LFTREARCSRCGESFSSERVLTVCTKCGGALLFSYDLHGVGAKVSRGVLGRRDDTFWKFMELLPLSSDGSIISLGEPYTPILRLPVGSGTALRNVYVKDDGRLPTGTFKARGMAVAVSRLRELGVGRVAVPSAGNAASALAAYGALAGVEVYAFLPKDVPDLILKECVWLGAKTFLVDGLINDAGEIVKRLGPKYGWFNISTNRQPYRVEGYKAIAFEVAEQFGWDPPDSIVFPTGGGEGVIGIWKGFKELVELGWVDRVPRLIVVQAAGCAPLVRAFCRGEPEVKVAWKRAETIAAGLRVPYPFASYLVLRCLRETEGTAVEVDDSEIVFSMKTLLGRGIYACPEAAASLAALRKLEGQCWFGSGESVLLYLTGSVFKYFELLGVKREDVPVLARDSESLDQAC
jgi:threonine synthase